MTIILAAGAEKMKKEKEEEEKKPHTPTQVLTSKGPLCEAQKYSRSLQIGKDRSGRTERENDREKEGMEEVGSGDCFRKCNHCKIYLVEQKERWSGQEATSF